MMGATAAKPPLMHRRELSNIIRNQRQPTLGCKGQLPLIGEPFVVKLGRGMG
jgi:hypothetical protein